MFRDKGLTTRVFLTSVLDFDGVDQVLGYIGISVRFDKDDI